MVKKIIASILSLIYLAVFVFYGYAVYGMTQMNVRYSSVASDPESYGYQWMLEHDMATYISIVVDVGITMLIVLGCALLCWILYLIKRQRSQAITFCVLNLVLVAGYLLVGGSILLDRISTFNEGVFYFTCAMMGFKWTGSYEAVLVIQDVIYILLPVVFGFIPLGWELIKKRKTKAIQ